MKQIKKTVSLCVAAATAVFSILPLFAEDNAQEGWTDAGAIEEVALGGGAVGYRENGEWLYRDNYWNKPGVPLEDLAGQWVKRAREPGNTALILGWPIDSAGLAKRYFGEQADDPSFQQRLVCLTQAGAMLNEHYDSAFDQFTPQEWNYVLDLAGGTSIPDYSGATLGISGKLEFTPYGEAWRTPPLKIQPDSAFRQGEAFSLSLPKGITARLIDGDGPADAIPFGEPFSLYAEEQPEAGKIKASIAYMDKTTQKAWEYIPKKYLEWSSDSFSNMAGGRCVGPAFQLVVCKNLADYFETHTDWQDQVSDEKREIILEDIRRFREIRPRYLQARIAKDEEWTALNEELFVDLLYAFMIDIQAIPGYLHVYDTVFQSTPGSGDQSNMIYSNFEYFRNTLKLYIKNINLLPPSPYRLIRETAENLTLTAEFSYTVAPPETAPETSATEATPPETSATEPAPPETSATEPTPPETSATEPTPPETSATEPAPPETSATEPTPPETSATEPAPPETSATEPTPPETSATEPAPPETSATEPTSPETSATEPAPPETSATEPTPPETSGSYTVHTLPPIRPDESRHARESTRPIAATSPPEAVSALWVTQPETQAQTVTRVEMTEPVRPPEKVKTTPGTQTAENPPTGNPSIFPVALAFCVSGAAAWYFRRNER